jgi:hypothetical protein
VPLPPCHEGNVKVFERDGIEVFGGGWSRGANPWAVDITLDLATYNDWWELPSGFRSARFIPRVIKMPTKDYDSPPVVSHFWEAFWLDLQDEAKPTNGRLKILIACQGGHGRTGTVLTALAHVAGIEAPDLIEWIRTTYCEEAVESKRQVEYLQAMGVVTEGKLAAPVLSTWSPAVKGAIIPAKGGESKGADTSIKGFLLCPTEGCSFNCFDSNWCDEGNQCPYWPSAVYSASEEMALKALKLDPEIAERLNDDTLGLMLDTYLKEGGEKKEEDTPATLYDDDGDFWSKL